MAGWGNKEQWGQAVSKGAFAFYYPMITAPSGCVTAVTMSSLGFAFL